MTQQPKDLELYLVLPLKVESGEMASDELSNEQLDAVAGGRGDKLSKTHNPHKCGWGWG